MNTRETKGRENAVKQDQIEYLDENHYEIKSQSRGIAHGVIEYVPTKWCVTIRDRHTFSIPSMFQDFTRKGVFYSGDGHIRM